MTESWEVTSSSGTSSDVSGSNAGESVGIVWVGLEPLSTFGVTAGGARGESSRVGSGTMLGADWFDEGSEFTELATDSTRTGISIPDFA